MANLRQVFPVVYCVSAVLFANVVFDGTEILGSNVNTFVDFDSRILVTTRISVGIPWEDHICARALDCRLAILLNKYLDSRHCCDRRRKKKGDIGVDCRSNSLYVPGRHPRI